MNAAVINKSSSVASSSTASAALDVEFLGWRVRVTTANAGTVEGTIRNVEGPTVSLSDAIISYSNGHYRFLSLLDIEKEDISNLSVIASSSSSPVGSVATSSLSSSQVLAADAPPPQPEPLVATVEEPSVKEPSEEPRKQELLPSEIPPVDVLSKPLTNAEDYPLIEIVYSHKKEQQSMGKQPSNYKKEPPQKKALWASGDAQEIKNEEFDIQASLAKFDKHSEFESLKRAEAPPSLTSVDPMALFRSMTLADNASVNISEQKAAVMEEKEKSQEKQHKKKTKEQKKEEKPSEVDYQPLSIINYASSAHELSLEAMAEFGGRELAAFLLPSLLAAQERAGFIINTSDPTFYSECCLAAVRHLLNRNIPVSLFLVSLPVLAPEKSLGVQSRVPVLLSKVDSVVEQGAVRCNRIKEAILTAKLIIDASAGALGSKIDAVVNRLISADKSLYAVAGKSSFHPQLVNALLFFGLVEECEAHFGGKDGALFDIGLPRAVYDAYGIRYPFIDSFTLHLTM